MGNESHYPSGTFYDFMATCDNYTTLKTHRDESAGRMTPEEIENHFEEMRQICNTKVYPIYADYTYLLDKEHHDAQNRSTIKDLEKQQEPFLAEQNKIAMQALEHVIEQAIEQGPSKEDYDDLEKQI